jgi:hypothetical protein
MLETISRLLFKSILEIAPGPFYNNTSSALALHSERFVYYCGLYFAPFSHRNSDFGYIEESTADYTLTPLSDLPKVTCVAVREGYRTHDYRITTPNIATLLQFVSGYNIRLFNHHFGSAFRK